MERGGRRERDGEEEGEGPRGRTRGGESEGPTFPVFTRKFGVFCRGHAENGGFPCRWGKLAAERASPSSSPFPAVPVRTLDHS